MADDFNGLSDKHKARVEAIGRTLSGAGVDQGQEASVNDLFKTTGENTVMFREIAEDIRQKIVVEAMGARTEMDKMNVIQGQEVGQDGPTPFDSGIYPQANTPAMQSEVPKSDTPEMDK